jgi:hypothetical protein
MRKIAVSYSTTLVMLRDKFIDEDVLKDALFYFGCTRAHALDATNYNITSVFRQNTAERERAHALIGKLVLAAEAEKRILWRKDAKTPPTFEQFNQLLQLNGFPALVLPDPWFDYYYGGVKKLVQEQLGDMLEVLY